MSEAEGLRTNDDRLELFWRARRPDSEARAVLLFVHGLAEHSGRYESTFDHFVERGYVCRGIDLRGHGRSDGRRVHVRSFEDYAQDVGVLRTLSREENPDLPTFLIGHSMGGLVVLLEALRRPDGLAGALISSPLLAAHPSSQPPAILHLLSQLVSKIAPGLLFPSDLDAELLSHDPEIVRAYREDPLVTGKVSARWYTSALTAMRSAFDEANELRLPMLLMQSGDDRLVDPDATRRWAETASKDLVDLKIWENFYHEMFNEPDRGVVFEHMESWLNARI